MIKINDCLKFSIFERASMRLIRYSMSKEIKVKDRKKQGTQEVL